ncbi:Detected protein of unknown function [Hibiscus syriacus]|uniref:Uncharacterized protein n=2 Tax=Hibiscus syriacus TaxID=106335 RepID=A0A6A3B264_HIBSY|nr:Detected protein of unknown function [Hibiscus syriacus]
MDLISITTGHIQKTTSFEKKPLMLKDYLLRDDLSSCSSNGFKLFPRQHCCTTVRFLLEAELKKSKVIYSTTTTTTTISAVQRASHSVLKAVKLLPFPSINSSSSSLKRNSSDKSHFTRSFSRKLFKRSFWRKADRKTMVNTNTDVVVTTDISATTMTASRVSSNASSNSWGETKSEFSTDVSQSWSGNSESSSENDTVEGETSLPHKQRVSNVVGVTVGDDSINVTKDWPKEERKELFSPVSVLDCPFDDEDDNSHFEDGSLHAGAGTKQKFMQKQKVRRMEGLAQLEPVDLEKRIAMTELEDEPSPLESLEADEKLLKALKVRIPSEMDDKLLLDLFREKGLEDFGVNGNGEDMFVGWEMGEGRKTYLKEMERNENWRNLNEENQDVGSAVELVLFSWLVDELLTDLF